MVSLSQAARSYLAAKRSREDRLARRHRRFPFLTGVAPIILRNPPLECLLPSRGRILVVGCGGGHCVLSLSTRERAAVGLDINHGSIGVAEELRRAVNGRASFSVARAEKLPFAPGSFDAVLSDNVVEHITLHPLRAHFAEARRVLAPGGLYVMGTPHPLCPTAHRPGHPTLLAYRAWSRMLVEAGFAQVRTPLLSTLRLGTISHKVWLERLYDRIPWRWGYAKLGLKTVKLVARA